MNFRENCFVSALSPLPERLKNLLGNLPSEIIKFASEIRLRINRPILITGGGRCYPLSVFGRTVEATKEEIEETFLNVCEHSVYSHEEELKNGYITIKGGHRVGVSGTAYSENGKVVAIKNVSSLCIRIAGKEPLTNKDIIDAAFSNGGSVIIAGAPGSGKTTILRDLAKYAGGAVSIIDERGELSGKYREENILLADADIFSGYPKAKGIEIATRCFAPEFIICDEIAPDDTEALLNALFSGVKIITSVHAGCREELFSRPFLRRIFSSGAFKTAILLKGAKTPGEIEEIIDLEDMF